MEHNRKEKNLGSTSGSITKMEERENKNKREKRGLMRGEKEHGSKGRRIQGSRLDLRRKIAERAQKERMSRRKN